MELNEINWNCEHCGELNTLDLSDLNLSDFVGSDDLQIDESEEMLALREQIKELQILNTRQQEDLQKAQTGISKAISKTEKPSMEIQGEIAEEILLDDLQDAFPKDEFKPIKKGESGADILQTIILPSGHAAGSILYESKSTKTWSNKWVDKLRSDMQDSGASVSLLVSKAFPAKESEALVQMEDRIWLCKPGPHVKAFVRALRQGIVMEARQKTLEEFASSSSKDALFDYITGDFVEQISNIGRVYSDLSDEMTKEKKAFKRKWAAREKLLEQLANSMTGVVGSISGIGVPSIKLEKIKELEL